ncbi:RICIN domain-containing protein [Agreia pratensis]|uniref:RICIN domain-containing protein n=1 Tax=Agreia pratensis TaxID=150121 RepID=UPI00188B03DB|nr:RICIN domain-containing protein [Agreia pratensis]MBF4633518.1 RICIN domain-containing protein [Agreia pratensis]
MAFLHSPVHVRRAGRIRVGHALSRLAMAAVATLLLTFSGGGPAHASWDTPEHSVTTSVSSGSLAITQSGFSSLATSYSSNALSVTAPVTVTNTGTVPAPYAFSLGMQTATALSSSASVQVWPVASASACTASGAASGATDKTWETVTPLFGTLAPKATVVYCVRSSVTQAQRFSLAGATTVATSTVTASRGKWSSTSTVTATQSVGNSLTPGDPTKVSETDSRISLSWTAPADTAAVTGYQVYRDGVLVTTVPASQRTFTDSGLDALRYYSYVIRSIHAANPVDVSPPSAAVAHSTAWWNGSSWYSVRNASSQLCVTGADGGTAEKSALLSSTCGTQSNQAWKFVTSADGTYVKVTPKSATTLFWDSPSDNNSILRTDNNIDAQEWQVSPVSSGIFKLVNGKGKCLDVTGNLLSGGTQLRVATCDGSANQQFALRNVG